MIGCAAVGRAIKDTRAARGARRRRAVVRRLPAEPAEAARHGRTTHRHPARLERHVPDLRAPGPAAARPAGARGVHRLARRLCEHGGRGALRRRRRGDGRRVAPPRAAAAEGGRRRRRPQHRRPRHPRLARAALHAGPGAGEAPRHAGPRQLRLAPRPQGPLVHRPGLQGLRRQEARGAGVRDRHPHPAGARARQPLYVAARRARPLRPRRHHVPARQRAVHRARRQPRLPRHLVDRQRGRLGRDRARVDRQPGMRAHRRGVPGAAAAGRPRRRVHAGGIVGVDRVRRGRAPRPRHHHPVAPPAPHRRGRARHPPTATCSTRSSAG